MQEHARDGERLPRAPAAAGALGRVETVTSADVAKMAGVSRGAVSQILNGRGERFSATTQERVREVARTLNYQPSAAARTLARGASELVVALVPDVSFGTNLQSLFDAVTDELSGAGLTLVLRLAVSSPDSFDRLVRTMHPLAVVSMTRLAASDRALLAERGVRLIEPEIGATDRVSEAIGALQAEYLISRGHTRLAYADLRDARENLFGAARLTGVAAVCSAHGLVAPTRLELTLDLADATRELARLGSASTAVACYNDEVAVALLGAARELGRQVPADVALIGLDNTPLAGLVAPRLTTVDVDLRAEGEAVAQTILDALQSSKAGPERQSVLPSLRVVEGGTC